MKKILFCFGTRPEAIKMAPLIKELEYRNVFQVKVVVTAQHRQMLDQVLEIFNIVPDYDLDLMTVNQNLESLTGNVLTELQYVIEEEKPDALVVQGDTTTTFASALAAYYRKIAVVHIEAGLRTYDKYAPYPEEMNRKLTSCLADWHFAPTKRSYNALISEGYPKNRVYSVGNTVVDALLDTVGRIRDGNIRFDEDINRYKEKTKIVLITGHRRENFGLGFMNICHAIRESAKKNPNVEYIYPVHLNPNVQEPVFNILNNVENIHLIEPCDYVTFLTLMDRSYIILTDSGGVQEEAPSLGKPVLVMRESTERPEALEAGVAKLVGTDKEKIVESIQCLLDDEVRYSEMSHAQNPYGDGKSSKRIADILEMAEELLLGEI